MRRYRYIVFALVFILVFLVGCSSKAKNLSFEGRVEEVYENSILVTTEDDVGFDLASVNLSKLKGDQPDIYVGDILALEISPEIRESYPVQVDAIKIDLVKSFDSSEDFEDDSILDEDSDLDIDSDADKDLDIDLDDDMKEDLEEDGADGMVEVEYRRISAEEAMEMMTEDAIILDVRTPEEYNAGHIEDAILMPDYELGMRAYDELLDMDQTILIYCRSGNRSMYAAKELIDLGYTNVYDFGGIIDWPGQIVREDDN